MSLRYFILPAILSNSNTKIYSKCKMLLMKNCHLRREFIKQNIELLNEDQIYALLPEYSIQHLIHWYGYNDEFTTETIEEMSKIMMFMIENVIENNADGISIIQHQLEILKLSNDNLFASLKLNENEMIISKINTINGEENSAEEVEKRMNEYQKKINERIYSCTLVSIMIFNEIVKNKKYKPKEEKGSLIKMMFVLREKDEVIESMIPFGYQLVKKSQMFFGNTMNKVTNQTNSVSGGNGTKVKRRKETKKVEDDENGNNEMKEGEKEEVEVEEVKDVKKDIKERKRKLN